MFKNRPAQLEELLAGHSKGDVFIPTELESIMHAEASELIRQKYDKKHG